MGITGLIPFLEKSSKRTNVSEFRGGTAAIDTYCWLHKGAFSCAEKLLMGEQTDGHIKYCMKFIQMLLANRIKPILVFDGRHLPAKAETESKRREIRTSNRRKAAELMRSGQTSEGRNMMRRCVDITHEMALDLMKQCQGNNIDCIVAPYEADAQLAYLNITGIADVVITEDSDLTLFGCKKILFKMDVNGNGLLVQQDRLHLAMGLREENFNMDQFLHMCILSGCDYLPSLPGIGLNKALKFILKSADGDICRSLPRIASYLNMKTLVVPKEYIDQFMKAVVTFKHQLVYCPLRRKQVRLNPPGSDVTKEQLHFAGTEVEEDVAFQLALGNCDPFSFKKLHDFHPDRVINKTKKKLSSHISIWSRDYKPKELSNFSIALDKKEDRSITVWPDTKGQVAILSTDKIKKEITPKKRTYREFQENLTDADLLRLYGSKKEENMKSEENSPFYLNLSWNSSSQSKESSTVTEEPTSPVFNRRVNPFLKTDSSPDLLACNRRRKLRFTRFKPTVIDENVVVESQFFAKLNMKNDDVDEDEGKIFKEKEEISRDKKIEIQGFLEENIEGQGEGVEKNERIQENGNLEENMEKMEEEGTEMEEIGRISEERVLKERVLEKNEIWSKKNLEEACFENTSSLQVELSSRNEQFFLHKTEESLGDSAIDNSDSNSYASKESISSEAAAEQKEERRESGDSDCEYFVSTEKVEDSKSTFFQRQNPKSSSGSSNKITTNSQKIKNKSVPKQPRKNRKQVQEQGQQSLLKMFGFQKKSTLQH